MCCKTGLGKANQRRAGLRSAWQSLAGYPDQLSGEKTLTGTGDWQGYSSLCGLYPICFLFLYSSSSCLVFSSCFRYSKISNIFSSCPDIFCSIFTNFNKISLWVSSISLTLTKTSIILILICIALSLFRTLASIKTPCSVKA